MSARLPVKVVPGASSNGIAGWMGDALRVRVTAPPERGKANAAVERIIADALGLPAHAVRVIKGNTSPRKVLEISGLTDRETRVLLPKNSAQAAT
jgi:uncharacterized protein (TIGR00251 family)